MTMDYPFESNGFRALNVYAKSGTQTIQVVKHGYREMGQKGVAK